MPVVPITAQRTSRTALSPPPVAPPAEPFALMAAAQMHSEGRLIQASDKSPAIHQYESLSNEDKEDWDRSPAKAVANSSKAQSEIPDGWEGLVTKDSNMLYMRPVPKGPDTEKDLVS